MPRRISGCNGTRRANNGARSHSDGRVAAFMTGYPPPPPSFPPRSPYPPPAFPPAGGTAYLPGAGYGVTHSKPTDVMGRRIGAYAIDLAIAFVIFLVMFFALASSSEYDTTAQATEFCDSLNDNPDLVCTSSGTTAFVVDSTEVEAILLAELGFAVVNFVLLTGLTGFSLGKLMTGIRVVHQQTGERCGVLRAFLRTILLVVPDLFGAVGVIVAASSSDHRRVGDMGASTLVVHKQAVGQPLPRWLCTDDLRTRRLPRTAMTPPGYGYPGGAAMPPRATAPPTAAAAVAALARRGSPAQRGARRPYPRRFRRRPPVGPISNRPDHRSRRHQCVRHIEPHRHAVASIGRRLGRCENEAPPTSRKASRHPAWMLRTGTPSATPTFSGIPNSTHGCNGTTRKASGRHEVAAWATRREPMCQ